jgi:hypothetical protein
VLVTSHGASVSLEYKIRLFQKLKLYYLRESCVVRFSVGTGAFCRLPFSQSFWGAQAPECVKVPGFSPGFGVLSPLAEI